MPGGLHARLCHAFKVILYIRHCGVSKLETSLLCPSVHLSAYLVLCGRVTKTYYTVSKKNDNDLLRYNFNAHQPILIIFGRYIAE